MCNKQAHDYKFEPHLTASSTVKAGIVESDLMTKQI